MKKIFKGIACLITLFSVNVAAAQNAHLMGPLTATDLGKTLQVCFDIAGLGNVSQTKLTITYTATVTTECTNKGGNVAPGQTKTYTNVGETSIVPVSNGRATGCKTTTTVFQAGSCPNGNWTGSVADVTFSNVSVTVAGKTFPVTSVQ